MVAEVLFASVFMAGGARIQWTNNGATGTVTNQGEIVTASGYTALAGPQVRNDGIIRAQAGSVVLAAGDRVNLDLIGDGLISISVDQAAMNASAINAGTIEADGGTVLLTVRSAGSLLDTVINAGGVIRATSLIERNGEIVLDGGSVGTVMVAGHHEAGSASVSGENITMTGTITTRAGSGSQTVTTPGFLIVQAGGGTGENAGLIHEGSGEQRVSAGNLSMMGGSSGSNNNAMLTSSNAAADQFIAVSGGMQVGGGGGGDNNQAIVRGAGNQSIAVGANLGVEGGAFSGPIGNNTAFVVGAASNLPDKKQTITAGSIIMRSGASGFQNGAVILAPRQEITTTGDVLLAGGGTAGTLGGVRMGGLSVPAAGINTATDLKLNVGNDLLMRGGVTPSNSANIGSTTGQPQTVTITATRDVVVNDSTASVSRIGTVQSTLPTNGTSGDISVSAGRDIRVNGGGEIVSLGKVTLNALNGAVKVEATSPTAGGARVQSGAGQDIQAQSVSVTATNGRSAQLINAGTGTQSVKAGTVEIKTVAPIGGLAEIRNNSAGDQTVTVTGDKLDIKAIGGGTATIFGGGNQDHRHAACRRQDHHARRQPRPRHVHHHQQRRAEGAGLRRHQDDRWLGSGGERLERDHPVQQPDRHAAHRGQQPRDGKLDCRRQQQRRRDSRCAAEHSRARQRQPDRERFWRDAAGRTHWRPRRRWRHTVRYQSHAERRR
jgi:hypothetical protein